MLRERHAFVCVCVCVCLCILCRSICHTPVFVCSHCWNTAGLCSSFVRESLNITGFMVNVHHQHVCACPQSRPMDVSRRHPCCLLRSFQITSQISEFGGDSVLLRSCLIPLSPSPPQDVEEGQLSECGAEEELGGGDAALQRSSSTSDITQQLTDSFPGALTLWPPEVCLESVARAISCQLVIVFCAAFKKKTRARIV